MAGACEECGAPLTLRNHFVIRAAGAPEKNVCRTCYQRYDEPSRETVRMETERRKALPKPPLGARIVWGGAMIVLSLVALNFAANVLFFLIPYWQTSYITAGVVYWKGTGLPLSIAGNALIAAILVGAYLLLLKIKPRVKR